MMIPFECRMCVAYVMKFYSEKYSHYIFSSLFNFSQRFFLLMKIRGKWIWWFFFPKWGYSSQNTWSVTSSENSAHHHQTLYCNAITSFDFPFARCVAITFEYFDSYFFLLFPQFLCHLFCFCTLCNDTLYLEPKMNKPMTAGLIRHRHHQQQ